MNIQELERRLYEEGCNPYNYAIGTRGAASDAFCLTHDGHEWRVYYTERGHDSAPIFQNRSEEDACRFFYAHIMNMRHRHCVGIFQSKDKAQSLHDNLKRHGLAPDQDKIPYGGPHDPRYRVFVTGKAIFKAKDILGDVPVHD